MIYPHVLKSIGVLGINNRNIDYLLPCNQRHLLPFVDDKVLTKKKLHDHNIPTPETYFCIESPSQMNILIQERKLADDFVIKPARGAEGRGILVLTKIGDGVWQKPSGALMHIEDLYFHITNILAGIFSLGSHLDKAIFEYKVKTHSVLDSVTFKGVPDVRILLYMGRAVMAMLRIPTRESNGRANLHQGAVGVGIDMATGKTVGGVYRNKLMDHHPDLNFKVAGIEIPYWQELVKIAEKTYPVFQLGYCSVDFVIDESKGPLILELNGRPGLNIQLANRKGLLQVL